MRTAKETLRRILDDLPDDASLEDIQYPIYIREKDERGLRDVEAGRVIDQDEAKRRMARRGRISQERAAQLAGLDRTDFILSLAE
jgi:hypothetical protein